MTEPVTFKDSYGHQTHVAICDESKTSSNFVMWNIYEIVSQDEEGIPTYHQTDSGVDWTQDIAEAIVFATITIKWDGCSHLYFAQDGYFHVCGYSTWENFSNVIKQLFLLSAEKMNLSKTEIDENGFPDNTTKGEVND